jgi:D-glycero-D-manno-heptose 1,7-bisphosphate phosphatase
VAQAEATTARRPALFLDRDGVINVDHGYVWRIEEVEFVDGIFDLVGAAHRLGYLVVVVTNQAGIGRGFYSEADFNRLMDWIRTEFERRSGAIDAVYYCPYHPEHGIGAYRRDSDCRKPAPGMFLSAAKDLEIDLTRSVMVGDKPSDAEAARAAGVGTRLSLSVRGDEASALAIPIRHLRDAISHLRPSAQR